MSKSLNLSEPLYTYLLDHSVREHPILARLRQETAAHPRGRMQISPDQGQLMMLLIRLMSAQKALEIGVFTGYSALCTALALPETGKLIACDVSEEYTNIARRYWQEAAVDHKIDLRIAPALETLDQLLTTDQVGTFDFVFIDADKQSYESYYERSLQLLRPGGLIVVDNVLWGGRVADPTNTESSTEALRRFNAKLHQDQRVQISLVPIADGLTLALKVA